MRVRKPEVTITGIVKMLAGILAGVFLSCFFSSAYAQEVIRTTRYFCAYACNADTNEGDRYEYKFLQAGKQIAYQLAGPGGFVILKEEGSVPDGAVREYYPSGQVRWDLNYKNNRLNGLCKMYGEKGERILEFQCRDGIPFGTRKQYYPSGALLRETFEKVGPGEVRERTYYESGAVKTESFNMEGLPEGFGVKDYYEDGTLRYTGYYYPKKAGSVIKHYDPNGKLKQEIRYEQGREVYNHQF